MRGYLKTNKPWTLGNLVSRLSGSDIIVGGEVQTFFFL